MSPIFVFFTPSFRPTVSERGSWSSPLYNNIHYIHNVTIYIYIRRKSKSRVLLVYARPKCRHCSLLRTATALLCCNYRLYIFYIHSMVVVVVVAGMEPPSYIQYTVTTVTLRRRRRVCAVVYARVCRFSQNERMVKINK